MLVRRREEKAEEKKEKNKTDLEKVEEGSCVEDQLD